MAGGPAMMTAMVMTVALVLGADQPTAPNQPAPNQPIVFTVVNGRMVVAGPDFRGVADRVEWDTARTIVTLEGQAARPAEITRLNRPNGQAKLIRARKIVLNYVTDTL